MWTRAWVVALAERVGPDGEVVGFDAAASMADRARRRDGLLCFVTTERTGAEDDPFVRASDWLFDRVTGYERLGCRPIDASRILEPDGFEIERRERHHRAWLWPVEILVARPL
jgi:hypothetical protein